MITDIAYYLPERVVTNDDLSQEFPDWDPHKIENKVGIRERRYAKEGETAGDLAVKASELLFERVDRQKIDFLILCTQSPDYFLPTTACVLQDKLSLRNDIGALDFNLGCSGFVYGLAIAKGLIATGVANQILLVMAETYSKHMHPTDRSNRTIFGDGAAASLIAASETNGIRDFVLGTDGSGFDKLIVKNGGFRCKFDASASKSSEDGVGKPTDNNIYMDGPAVFNFTIDKIPALFNNVLEKNQLESDDVDLVIFHQANKYILNYLRKKIGIPPEKFYINMVEKGNTVSATIPIALKDAMNEGLLKSGQKVLICGFGVGLSWGGTVIEV